jgi:hypothetical protein
MRHAGAYDEHKSCRPVYETVDRRWKNRLPLGTSHRLLWTAEKILKKISTEPCARSRRSLEISSRHQQGLGFGVSSGTCWYRATGTGGRALAGDKVPRNRSARDRRCGSAGTGRGPSISYMEGPRRRIRVRHDLLEPSFLVATAVNRERRCKDRSVTTLAASGTDTTPQPMRR